MRISDWSSGRVLFRSSSSGGELVGSQRQGDASAVTLDLNKRLDVRAPIPEEFGVKAGDDSVDSATGIQAAMLNCGYQLERTELTGLGLVEYKTDRKSVVSGKSELVRVDLGGRRYNKTTKITT